jgi:hypothetical protein
MSLIDLIEKIQKKPRHVRIQIMWLVVGVCMIFIFFGWFWSLSLNMKIITPTGEAKNSQESWQQIKQDIPTLWSSLSAGISNVLDSFKQEAQEQKNQEIISPTPLNSGEPVSLPIE